MKTTEELPVSKTAGLTQLIRPLLSDLVREEPDDIDDATEDEPPTSQTPVGLATLITLLQATA